MSVAFSVFLKIIPGRETEFVNASKVNQRGARQEPGNLRFDIYRSRTTSSHFLFLEAYDSEESTAQHRETAHFKQWLETVTPLLEEPRERVPGNDLPAEYEEVS